MGTSTSEIIQESDCESAGCCLLSVTDIFTDLTPQQVDEIERTISVKEVEKGRIIYMPEDSGEVLFILRRGRVQLYRLSADGRKLVLSILGPGTIFGEMSLVGQGMHQTFAEAVEDSTVCVMGREDVERLILNEPQVALRLVAVIGERLTEAESRLRDIAFKSVPARVASLLLRLAGNSGTAVEGFTHQELSEIIGTYRETTTQTLNEFRSRGYIVIGRKHIDILNAAALKQIADN
jgi:CRP/FNR family transcriptional regulator, cyclic AMP receptor protein